MVMVVPFSSSVTFKMKVLETNHFLIPKRDLVILIGCAIEATITANIGPTTEKKPRSKQTSPTNTETKIENTLSLSFRRTIFMLEPEKQFENQTLNYQFQKI